MSLLKMKDYQSDSLDWYPRGNDPATHHGQSSAQGMAQDAANTHTIHVLSGGKDDGGHLRPVAPLSHGGHGEGLDEDLTQHGECSSL